MSLTESGRAPESIPLLEELHLRMARAYGNSRSWPDWKR